MTCSHCENTVTSSLTPIEHLESFSIDLSGRKVRLVFDSDRFANQTLQEILTELRDEQDFDVELLSHSGFSVEPTTLQSSTSTVEPTDVEPKTSDDSDDEETSLEFLVDGMFCK
eukprot:TRINITY_DN3864_c0_g1_i3.p2 TRINITY_DN3864_c0_g1~~TRINITY_DN3864_c0_g1_i3.p2  ORF type:complete len:114 (-),score=29.73 TRINITY_DN3864_c0_g1_i3:84-425(-)